MGALNVLRGALTWIILWIIIFLPLLVLVICKYFVILCAKIFRPDLSRFAANDVWVTPDSSVKKPLVNFGFLIRCKGKIKVQAIRERFSMCFLEPRDEFNVALPKYQNLYSYIVTYCGYVFRKSVSQVDIESHIYERSLGQNEIIEDLAADWMLRSYNNENSPNWEIILIPLGASEETVICFKIHHAFLDGYSLLYIIDKITGVKSPYLVKPFQDSILSNVRQMLESASHLGVLLGDPDRNPFKITQLDKPMWIYSFTSVDLNLVKAIRRKQNVHFASVMLSLIIGSVRQYLLETRTKDKLPPLLCGGSTLPWPNHPVRSPNVTLCNHWIAGIIKLPLDIEDPLERLKTIEKDFANFYTWGMHKLVRRFMLPILGTLPARVLQASLSKDPGFPIGLTSIVGGNDYKMIARPISAVQPLLAIPHSNPFIALSCFTFSHGDKLDITFGAHPEHFPSHEDLDRVTKNYFNEELKMLCSVSEVGSVLENVDN